MFWITILLMKCDFCTLLVVIKVLNFMITIYMLLICCKWTYFICTSYASSGELIFEPGDKEVIIAVNVLDDTVPEEDRSFRVQLKNPKGGAEIGINGYVQITILSNVRYLWSCWICSGKDPTLGRQMVLCGITS